MDDSQQRGVSFQDGSQRMISHEDIVLICKLWFWIAHVAMKVGL